PPQRAVLPDRLATAIPRQQFLGAPSEPPPDLPSLPLDPGDRHAIVAGGLMAHPGDHGGLGPLVHPSDRGVPGRGKTGRGLHAGREQQRESGQGLDHGASSAAEPVEPTPDLSPVTRGGPPGERQPSARAGPRIPGAIAYFRGMREMNSTMTPPF